MTLLQLLTFLYNHGELTFFLGILFLATLWAIERIITQIINRPLQLEEERTKQLTLQLEQERQAKPKPATIAEYDYESGYQQAMEQ